MTTLLTSREFLAEYGALLDDACARSGLRCDTVLLPPIGGPAPPPAELSRVEAALCSRDVRFSKPGFARFADLSAHLPNLRWMHFGNASAGPYAWTTPLRERGVVISASTGANAEPVAQTGLFGMLFLAKPGRHWIGNQAARGWDLVVEPHVPADIAGQTVMIVGVGMVGSHFARYAKALRMHVIGVRRSPRRDDDLADEIVPPSRLHEMMPRCDWVVLCCPLTPETRGLVDRRAIGLMKPTAHVINIARGEVVDEQALLEALQAKRIAGAHLDVFTTEPLPKDSPFWDLPNVLITPHNAAAAAGNNQRSAEIFIGNFVRYGKGEPLRNVIEA